MRRRIVEIFICGLIIFSGAGVAAERTLDRIVAFAADRAITERELRAGVSRFANMLEQQGREVPAREMLVGEVLQKMIIRALQLHEAERLGMVADEASVERAIESIAEKNNMTLAEMRRAMEEQGEDYKTFHNKVREDLLIRRVQQREVVERINVSDAEIRRRLYASGEDVAFRYSYLRVAVGTEKSGRSPERLLASIKRRAAEGGEFLELAREAAQTDGAELIRSGWRASAQMPAAIAKRVVAMEVGAVAPIIKTPKHLYLLRLDARRKEGEAPVMQRQYRVRHILIAPNVMDTDEIVRKKLRKMKRRIENGADFARYAKRYSQDPGSGFKGGDLGWIDLRNMVAEFSEKVRAARKGELVGPFRTQYGWHLLRVSDTREQDMSEQLERAGVIAEIRQEKAEAEINAWLLRLRERYYVDVRL